jgi:hypothetical protein
MSRAEAKNRGLEKRSIRQIGLFSLFLHFFASQNGLVDVK